MIVLICCSWICVSRYHSPMVFFCFVDIYPRPSFIVHFQIFVILVLSFTFFFYFMINQYDVQLLTHLQITIHSLFISSSCFLVLSFTCFFSSSWSLWCSNTNFYIKPFMFVLSVPIGVYCWLSIVVITLVYYFPFCCPRCFKLCQFLIYSSFVVGSGGYYLSLWDLGIIVIVGSGGFTIEYGYWGIIIYHWVFHFLFTFLFGFIRFSSPRWFIFFLKYYFEIGEHNGDFCYMFSF